MTTANSFYIFTPFKISVFIFALKYQKISGRFVIKKKIIIMYRLENPMNFFYEFEKSELRMQLAGR